METRQCTKCNKVKEVDLFAKGVNWRRCKTCVNEAARAIYNGGTDRARELKEERDFRNRMYKEGFSYCAECGKWKPKDEFSADRNRKSGCFPLCKHHQRLAKNERDDGKREPALKENRKRADELFAAKQRECPGCGTVYHLEPPRNMRGKAPRWWAAWKLCRVCRGKKEAAYRDTRRTEQNRKQNERRKLDPVKRLYRQARSRQTNNRGKAL